MFQQESLFDDIGPQRIFHVYDAQVGLKGMLVIDTAVYGRYGGGIRMVPDLTIAELRGLARAMTYKFAILGIPRGGAKLGIIADSYIKGVKRTRILKRLGEALRPFLCSGLGTGADIGIFENDLDIIFQGAQVKRPGVGLSKQKVHGDSLEYYTTSYGVFNSVLAACDVQRKKLSGATAAVEGFGKVGTGVAFFLKEAGARVVAVSTLHGALYDPNGLDVEKLIQLRKRYGDKLVMHYSKAQTMKKEKIHFLPVDILVPGARPHVITEKNVKKVQARIIASAANNPISDAAEKILFQRDVAVVPDFISNAGGTIFAMLDRLGRKPKEVFPILAGMLGPLSKDILRRSRKTKTSPRTVALKKVHSRLRRAYRNREAYSDQKFAELLYDKFSL
jgi:glutamate dehydrogenase/leucine dehydrogenase